MCDEYNNDYDPTDDQDEENIPEMRGFSAPYGIPISIWTSKPPEVGDDDIGTPWNLKIRLIGTPPTTSFENYEESNGEIKNHTAIYFLLIPNKGAKIDSEFLYNLMTCDLLFRFILSANFNQCQYISDSNTDARIMMTGDTVVGVFVVYTALKPEPLDIPHMYSNESCVFSDPKYKVQSIIYTKQNLTYSIPVISTMTSIMPQDGFTNELENSGDVVDFWNWFIRDYALGMINACSNKQDDPFFQIDTEFEKISKKNSLGWISLYSLMFGYGLSMHLFHNYNANYTDLEIRVDNIYGYRVKRVLRDELILGKNPIVPTINIPEGISTTGVTIALSSLYSLPQMIYIPTNIEYRNFEHYASEPFYRYNVEYKYLRLLHTNYYQEDALERIIEGIPYQFGRGMIYFINETPIDIAFTNRPNLNFLGVLGVNLDFVSDECKSAVGLSKYIQKKFNDNQVDVILSLKVYQYAYFLVMSSTRTIGRMKWRFRKDKINEVELIRRARSVEEYYANQKDE